MSSLLRDGLKMDGKKCSWEVHPPENWIKPIHQNFHEYITGVSRFSALFVHGQKSVAIFHEAPHSLRWFFAVLSIKTESVNGVHLCQSDSFFLRPNTPIPPFILDLTNSSGCSLWFERKIYWDVEREIDSHSLKLHFPVAMQKSF